MSDVTGQSDPSPGAGTDFVQPEMPGLPAGVSFEATWSGPYPPPGIVSAYNQIVPDLGNKLVETWLEEIDHRRQREMLADRREGEAVKRAQYIGGTVFIIIALGAAVSAMLGNAAAAGYLAGADAIGGLAPVLYGWARRQSRDDQDNE